MSGFVLNVRPLRMKKILKVDSQSYKIGINTTLLYSQIFPRMPSDGMHARIFGCISSVTKFANKILCS